MELIKRNTSEYSPITKSLSTMDLLHMVQDEKVKEEMINDQYLPVLRSLVYENEENNKHRFEGFTDVEMIYYFVHRQKHVDRSEKLSETTVKDYVRDIFQFYKHWLQYLASSHHKKEGETGNYLQFLEPRHIEMYQTDWMPEKAGYKPATIARKSIVIRGFLRWLYKEGYLKTPLHSYFVSSAVKQKHTPNRDLTYEEVKMLLEYWKEKNHPINYAILTMLATTGLRIQEVCKAKWSELFYDSSTGHYFLSSKGKNEKHRDALIFPYVLEALKDCRRRRRLPTELNRLDKTPLIPTRSQEFYDYTYLSRYVKKIIKETELPFLETKPSDITPHWFRHFFANHSLDNGANIEYIRQTLGHSMLKTTLGYLNKNIERKNNAALVWQQEEF
ncbi:tyrosine-type recombinase/integrase [Ectobacillus funiculus]|uniref:tyrosine-type recombinase/integrase n=1 Tax=Ectobacillus funiculus TaxID=137993 RepID=UPI00397E2B97